MPALPTLPLVRTERIAWAVALALTMVALTFHLGTMPDGCFHDEVSIGFNARSIWRTGLDQFGVRLPLYYQGIGDWKGPLPLYAMALSTAVFGNTPVALRATGVLFDLGMAALLWWCIRKLTGSCRLARWLALFALLIPSTFHYARAGTAEPACFPFFTALAIFGVLRFEQGPTPRRAAIAGALLGLGAYAYPAARLFMPLAAVSAVLCFFFHRPTRKLVWIMIAGGLALAIPMAVFMVRHPHALLTRLDMISIFGRGSSRLEIAGLFLSNYLSHFGFDFLFRFGQKEHHHWHNIGTGFVSLWMLFPLIFGLVVLIQGRDRPFYRFLLLVLLAAPIPASMTIDDVPHPNRILHVVPILVLICSLGVAELVRRLAPSPGLVAALLGLVVLENAGMVRQYFTEYPRVFEADNPGGIDQGRGRAMRLAFAHRQQREPVFFPRSFFDFDGMMVGFWGDLDPADMRKNGPSGSGVRPVEDAGDPTGLPAGTLWATEQSTAPPFPADVVGAIPRFVGDGVLWTIYRKR